MCNISLYNCGFYTAYLKNLKTKIKTGLNLNLTTALKIFSTYKLQGIINPSLNQSLINKDGIFRAQNSNMLTSVAENIISRGIPTLPSVFIEETLVNNLKPQIKVNVKKKVKIEFKESKYKNIKEDEWLDKVVKAHKLLSNKKTTKKELYKSKIGIKALKIVFVPFAVARIEKTILMLLRSGILSLDNDSWEFVIIERDIMAARLAFKDLYSLLTMLINLMGLDITIPELKLYIYRTDRIYNISENITTDKFSAEIFVIDNINNIKLKADLLLDVHLFKKNIDCNLDQQLCSKLICEDGFAFTIKSVKKYKDSRYVNTSKAINYKLTKKKKKYLIYFLQNIFRKEKFREGQFSIIQRSLNLKSVIGLLATGAGKSLCYQLSALLQPGITIVIQPIKSLMFDQQENMREMGLDCVNFLNSDLNYDKKKKIINNISRGKLQILLIAPERLQTKSFRKLLKKIRLNCPIVYIVVDEAHCISEWGHDFRPSYLNLKKVVSNYCSFNSYRPAFIALTGTASFSVLGDIERELDIRDKRAKITPATFNREELKFKIYKVPSFKKEDELKIILSSLINSITKDDRSQSQDETSNPGLIFVPHVNGKYGVYHIKKELEKTFNLKVGCYSGKAPLINDNGCEIDQQEYNKYKDSLQKKFKDDQISLLVCTKSFGMGIDKTNIRYTIHYGIPSSLEDFYQQAGRAGRDGKDAVCNIIFSDDNYQQADKMLDANVAAGDLNKFSDLKKHECGDIHRLMYFHKNSFQGVKKDYLFIKNKLMENKIYNILAEMHVGEKKAIKIHYSYQKNKYEKAIQRLAVIGIISDYTVDFYRQEITAIIVKKDKKEYVTKLIDYIARYKTRVYIDLFKKRMKQIKEEQLLDKMLVFLIKFIYKEIEQKRRSSLRTMVEVARKYKSDKKIRQALLAYMEESPFMRDLERIEKRIESQDWWDLLDRVENKDHAWSLFYGVRRKIESNPDHPGFYLISALARLFFKKAEIRYVTEDIKKGVESIAANNLQEKINTEAIIEEFIAYFKKRFKTLANFELIYKKIMKVCYNTYR